MRIERAGHRDIRGLARVKWIDRSEDQADADAFETFLGEFSSWWVAHRDTLAAFVARSEDGEVVGAAWVALLPRVPSPGSVSRLSADIQSVFVMPEHRGAGLGTALVAAASTYAEDAGALRITVHSSERAVSLYRGLGYDGSVRLLQRVSKA